MPYLFFDDAAAAIDFYTRVFGFEEQGRWTNDQGVVHNAEMRIGDAELWLDGSGWQRLSPRPRRLSSSGLHP